MYRERHSKGRPPAAAYVIRSRYLAVVRLHYGLCDEQAEPGSPLILLCLGYKLIEQHRQYFSFSKSGRYSVTATVHIKEWNRNVVSPPTSFDIIEGSKLWEQDVGLPNPEGVTNRPPEMRRFALHQANYLRRQLLLYVQITDTRGHVYRVFPLGQMLSFGQPEPQVDRWSNLHVLYQNGPRSFSYTLVDPYGNILARQFYDYTTRPRLKPDGEGNVQVVGGTRRITSTDLPPPNGIRGHVENGG